MKSLILMTAIALCPARMSQESSPWRVPDQLKACLARSVSLARSELILDVSRNPYYLRGDFDGDGSPDLAVALKSRSDDFQVGIGVCRRGVPPVLLGSIAKGKRFSDDPADILASPGWVVITRSELVRMLQTTNPRRHAKTGILSRVPGMSGEMIYMPYETYEGVVYYWHGQFRWYTINSADFPQ